MIKAIIILVVALVAPLLVGYYRAFGEMEVRTYFFIKKYPAFKIEFENMFAHYGDHKSLPELNAEERQQVMDYCKYRLGIITTLETQDELERCKAYR